MKQQGTALECSFSFYLLINVVNFSFTCYHTAHSVCTIFPKYVIMAVLIVWMRKTDIQRKHLILAREKEAGTCGPPAVSVLDHYYFVPIFIIFIKSCKSTMPGWGVGGPTKMTASKLGARFLL